MASMSWAESPREVSGDDRFLRWTLWFDVAVSSGNVLVYLLIPGVVGDWLGLSPALLRGVGVFFAFYVAWVFWVASRQEMKRGLAWSVVVLNASWMVLSLGVALLGLVETKGFGTAWIIMQGVAVGGLALVQWLGIRRWVGASGGA
jgi:hypothetical protein